jgi:hypothetical protein
MRQRAMDTRMRDPHGRSGEREVGKYGMLAVTKTRATSHTAGWREAVWNRVREDETGFYLWDDPHEKTLRDALYRCVV